MKGRNWSRSGTRDDATGSKAASINDNDKGLLPRLPCPEPHCMEALIKHLTDRIGCQCDGMTI